MAGNYALPEVNFVAKIFLRLYTCRLKIIPHIYIRVG